MKATLRPVEHEDWPALLELANASVKHVPGAGPQQTWLDNRRRFDRSSGVQRQFVAVVPDSPSLVGYGAIEWESEGKFRLFLVTPPDRLPSVGELLYSHSLDVLHELGARRVWFTEYAADEPLLTFAAALGFQEARRFVLPEGTEAITLKKELDDVVTAPSSIERDAATASTEAAWNLTAEKFATDIERDVAFLRSGGVSLEEPEVRVLRSVISGGIAIHLQCSHGLDALSLLNLGIDDVIGLDISEKMLALAREKSDLLRAPARWVHADVLEPPAELLGLADLVYTGKGALPWVRDIARWAAVVKSLLREGGHLFVFEGHPLDWIWDPEADTHRLHSERSYFDTQARANEDFPARAVELYTSPDQVPPPAWEYHWSLGDLVTALARVGLRVEALEEHADHYWPRFKNIPSGELERVPHTFSLLARSTTA